MFTGLVAAIGEVVEASASPTGMNLTVTSGTLDLGDVRVGDSIAVNGCCLTVTAWAPPAFSAAVSNATLSCTTLGAFGVGTRVNLEKAMAADGRLGGHWVSGHVDGCGELTGRHGDGDSERMAFRVPESLSRYLAPKGSVCIDGTSLTIVEADDRQFRVNVIPHTLENTIMGDYQPGQAVNVEVDIIARYLERLLAARMTGGGAS